jgi:hypothetical protein
VFTCTREFNVHNSHLWARRNPHAIGERVYEVRFSVGVWAGIVRDIVTDPYVLSDRLTAQRYRGFPETFVPGLLNMYLSLWGTGCGFSTTELQRTVGRCLAVVERDIDRNVDWTSWAYSMASSVAGCNSDGLYCQDT